MAHKHPINKTRDFDTLGKSWLDGVYQNRFRQGADIIPEEKRHLFHSGLNQYGWKAEPPDDYGESLARVIRIMLRAEKASAPALWSNRQSRVLPFIYDESLRVPALAVSKAFACSPHRDSTAKGVPETVMWYLPADFSMPDGHMYAFTFVDAQCICPIRSGTVVIIPSYVTHGTNPTGPDGTVGHASGHGFAAMCKRGDMLVEAVRRRQRSQRE